MHQLTKFEEQAHSMFLNIFIHKPHASVFPFVRKYIPYYAEDFIPGGWSAVAADSFKEPNREKVVHSYIFFQHPFFEADFTEGEMDFIVWEVNNRFYSLIDHSLWFIFKYKDEARNAFDKLVSQFRAVSTSEKMYTEGVKTIAEFTDSNTQSWINEVQFIFTPDLLFHNRYKLFFRIGIENYDTE